MKFNAMTDEAVAAEMGRRIEQLRLERNFTQQYMADAIGVSRVSYRKLEMGEAKWVNVIAALRVLNRLDTLEALLPDTVFSPIEQLKMQGKVRKRASGSRGRTSSGSSADQTDAQAQSDTNNTTSDGESW